MGPSGSGLHHHRRGALAVAVVAHAQAGALTRVAVTIVLDKSARYAQQNPDDVSCFREVRFVSGDEFPPDERVPLAVIVNLISKPRVRDCANLGSSRTMFASLPYSIARLAQTLDLTREAAD